MAELITVEGTAGARFTVDPDVPWVAAQLANRMLAQVERPEPETGPERPAQAATKEVWVAYIVATTDLSEAEAADLTKADLIALAAEEE